MFHFVPAASNNGHFQLSGPGLKKAGTKSCSYNKHEIPALYDLMTQPLVTSNWETIFFAASIRHLEYVSVNLKCERRPRLAECLKILQSFFFRQQTLQRERNIFEFAKLN